MSQNIMQLCEADTKHVWAPCHTTSQLQSTNYSSRDGT